MSDSLSQRYVGPAITRAISVWGLLLLLILLIIVFSLLRPDTFPTFFNIKSILNNKSVQALVALAVFIPMTANHFDLSAGFNLGISQVLVIGLQGQGLPWWAAVIAVLLMGALVGLANGFLVTRIKIDSFIATLGHGHDPLRAERLVHRRPAGPGRPAPFLPGDLRQHRGGAGAGALHADHQLRALDRLRISAAGALPLRPRRQPAHGGAERHLGQALCHPGLRRRRDPRLLRRHRAAIPASDRPELRRPGISAAGLHRGPARRDLDPAGPRQCLGHGAGRRGAGGDGGGAEPARRARSSSSRCSTARCWFSPSVLRSRLRSGARAAAARPTGRWRRWPNPSKQRKPAR